MLWKKGCGGGLKKHSLCLVFGFCWSSNVNWLCSLGYFMSLLAQNLSFLISGNLGPTTSIHFAMTARSHGQLLTLIFLFLSVVIQQITLSLKCFLLESHEVFLFPSSLYQAQSPRISTQSSSSLSAEICRVPGLFTDSLPCRALTCDMCHQDLGRLPQLCLQHGLVFLQNPYLSTQLTLGIKQCCLGCAVSLSLLCNLFPSNNAGSQQTSKTRQDQTDSLVVQHFLLRVKPRALQNK